MKLLKSLMRLTALVKRRLVSTSQLPPLQYANLVKCDYSVCQASSCFGTREFPSQSKLLFLIVISFLQQGLGWLF